MNKPLQELDDFCWKQVLRILGIEPKNRESVWQAAHTEGHRKPSLADRDTKWGKHE